MKSMRQFERSPECVTYDDVDDVIGIAAEMVNAREDMLSVADLEDVARQLDIPEEYVKPAIRELRARREAAVRAAKGRRKRRLIAAAIGGGVAALLLVIALVGQAGLRSDLGTAEQKRAQVKNVLERQVTVQKRYENQPLTTAREAELAGAENRVHIERKRYDEAASEYNTSASTFPGSLWVTLFGLPERVELSGEIEDW